jgi:RluA family pseudouridine synthase
VKWNAERLVLLPIPKACIFKFRLLKFDFYAAPFPNHSMTSPSFPPILYEDESIIAFDKPSGLLVAPDRWDKDLANLMDLVHGDLGEQIANVHRIDKDTSGILLCAKTESARDSLLRQFELHLVDKIYLAIVRGSPPQQEEMIKTPLREDPERPGRMKTSHRFGKKSETHYKVLQPWRSFSLLEVSPKTGRTHQIRVHLSFVGCPIVADPFYGSSMGLYLSEIKRKYKLKEGKDERPLMGRLALHAQNITFKHPMSKEFMTLESPLPKDFNISIRYLGQFNGL